MREGNGVGKPQNPKTPKPQNPFALKLNNKINVYLESIYLSLNNKHG